MTTDLTVPGDSTAGVTPALRAGALDYPTMLQLGAAFAASGLFPGVKDQGVAVVKILAGAEWGLEPVAAMNGIDIIAIPNRPPRMRPNTDVQALLARRAGYDFTPLEHTAEKCVLEWRHNGKVLGTSEFSVAQAQKARLVRDGGAWQAWPENMTLARAITQGVKLFCRHILAGSIGGMQIVTTDELEQEYPDPRDDLVKALFATYRECFPSEPEMSADEARDRRLDWSSQVLGRFIDSWNGPEAPETLTRADVQTLLDELARLQAAPDSGPAAGPLTPEHPGSANISAGAPPGTAALGTSGDPHASGNETPAERHSDEELGEVPSPEGAEPGGGTEEPDVPASPPSGPASTNDPAVGASSSAGVAPVPTKAPAAPVRKHRRTDPGGAPSVAQVQAHQKTAEQTRKQETIDRGPTRWRFTVPQPQLGQLTAMFHGKVNDLEEFLRTFAEQEPDVPALTEWTDRHWPDAKLAVLMEAARAETSLR